MVGAGVVWASPPRTGRRSSATAKDADTTLQVTKYRNWRNSSEYKRAPKKPALHVHQTAIPSRTIVDPDTGETRTDLPKGAFFKYDTRSLRRKRLSSRAGSTSLFARSGLMQETPETTITDYGRVRAAHRSSSWERNGPKVNSCEEYGYEMLYDWGRFTDAMAACKGDWVCETTIARDTGNPGITRTMRRKDGVTGGPQARDVAMPRLALNSDRLRSTIPPKSRPKNSITVVPGLAALAPDGPRAKSIYRLSNLALSPAEREELAKILDNSRAYYTERSTSTATKAGTLPRTYKNLLDFHTKLAKSQASQRRLSEAEYAEFERRKREFGHLVRAWEIEASRESEHFEEQIARKKDRLKFDPVGPEMPYGWAMDPVVRLSRINQIAMGMAARRQGMNSVGDVWAPRPRGKTRSPSTRTAPSSGATRVPSPSSAPRAPRKTPAIRNTRTTRAAGPAKATGSGSFTTGAVSLPKQNPGNGAAITSGMQVDGVTTIDSYKDATLEDLYRWADCEHATDKSNAYEELTILGLYRWYEPMWRGEHSCRIGVWLRREYARMKAGELSCLDPSHNLCDWSPDEFHRVFVSGLPYLDEMKQHEEECETWFINAPKNMTLAAVSGEIENLKRLANEAKEELAPYRQAKAGSWPPRDPGTPVPRSGASGPPSVGRNFWNGDAVGDKSLAAVGYKANLGWQVTPTKLSDNQLLCRAKGKLFAEAGIDAWLVGSEIPVVGGSIDAQGEDRLIVDAGFTVMGAEIWPTTSKNVGMALFDDGFSSAVPVPDALLRWTITVGPIPVTGEIGGELVYGVDFKSKLTPNTGGSNCNDPKGVGFGIVASSEPYFGANGTASVGVGVPGMMVGIRGVLNLLQLGFPVSTAVNTGVFKLDGATAATVNLGFDVAFDLSLSTLAGRLLLFVEVMFVEESFEIFSWSGITHTIPLMTPLDVDLPIAAGWSFPKVSEVK